MSSTGQGSSTESSLSSEFSDIHDIIKNIFREDEFVSALEKCIERVLSKRQREFEEKIERQEGDIHDLKVALDKKEAQVQSLTTSMKSLGSKIEAFESRANDLEQYSRRNSVRVFGVPETSKESTDDLVLKVVSEHLSCPMTKANIDRSHRSGKPRTDDKPRPILVKLSSHRMKAELMKERRKLKGSGISIQEDLTSLNHKILIKLATHPKVEAAWSIDGRVMAALKTNEEGVQVKKLFSSLQQAATL